MVERIQQDTRTGRDPRRRKKSPPPISLGDFERAAARHLDRYPTTVGGLRTVLERRAQRSQTYHGGEASDATPIIEAVLARCLEHGLLDDRAYGHALLRRMRKRGSSLPRVRSQLLAKGVPADLCEELLQEISGLESEQVAAQVYARRRGLGPHRERPELRSEYRERDLAKLGRAGFPSEIAVTVIDAEETS
ncbi:MAG: regulatory protein RecX [Myxococcota bacterium]